MTVSSFGMKLMIQSQIEAANAETGGREREKPQSRTQRVNAVDKCDCHTFETELQVQRMWLKEGRLSREEESKL